jgi:putative hydrolase of the HAD superfamily
VSSRAILFDLDDTLYPYSGFVRSGFRAVARRLATERGLSPRLVLRVLRAAWTSGNRGRELQVLCERLGLPASLVPPLVALMREHVPSLRLPQETREVLQTLRRDWRIGIVTNGNPDIQRRKIAALGLEPLVDAIVCARECGDGRGKPAPAAFQAGLERLHASTATTVFVGNDRETDVAGADAAGLPVIHLVDGDSDCPDGSSCRGRHARRLADVPGLANHLVPLRTELHGL